MENNQPTKTRGNVIVQNIKVGDIHYEFDMGLGIKCQVLTLPKLEDGTWIWQSKNLNTGVIIDYGVWDVNEEEKQGFKGFGQQFGQKLYDYEVYKVDKWV